MEEEKFQEEMEYTCVFYHCRIFDGFVSFIDNFQTETYKVSNTLK